MNDCVKKQGLMPEMRESFFGIKAKNLKTRTKLITLMGVLTALCIVVERTIFIPVGDSSRYSFTFAAVALCGITLGGLKGAVVAMLADVIGSLILYGNANPLITVCVCLSAMSFGIILYSKRTPVRIVIAVLIDQIVSALILKTGALAIWYYGGMNAYATLFGIRLVQVLIMIPVEIIVLLLLEKYLFGTVKKLVKEFVE